MASNSKTAAFIVSLCLASQTAHAEPAPGSDLFPRKGYISGPEQHRAIVDCHYELGKGGYPKMQAIYVAYPWGGDTDMRILPGYYVSPEEASWINACADAKLGRNSGTNARMPGTGRGDNCPRHAPALYGGSRYCIGG